MPEFLAYATGPDGTYVQLGDTDLQTRPSDHRTRSPSTPRPPGLSGPKPPATIRRYAAGYLFARSGWGETRPFDRTRRSSRIRFGPGHGPARPA